MTIFSTTLLSIAPVSAASNPARAAVAGAAQPAGVPRIQPQGTLANGASGVAWTPLGPAPAGPANLGSNNYGISSGRITAIAVNPKNSSDVWIGAADGGLWHSTDGGNHWVPVTDNQPTLSIGAIAFDPNNVQTIYAGTGEANGNSDAYWGAGLLKSTDGGVTWTQLGFSQLGGEGIAKIAVDPTDSATLLVAASFGPTNTPPGGGSSCSSEGIWRSTDGGVTWTQVISDNAICFIDAGTDVLFDPAHPGVAFAGLGNTLSSTSTNPVSIAGVYKSTDHGKTWTLLSNGIPTGSNIERVSLGISQDGNHLYAALTDGGLTSRGQNLGDLLFNSIYVSTDNGLSWSSKNVCSPPWGPSYCMADDLSQQLWWYDSTVAVDPTDSTGNTAYIGGVDLWQTTDGGTTWNDINTAPALSQEAIHPRLHALAFFSTASSSYYIGNDGGIWSGTSAGTFTNLNGGGLNITQFYSGSIGEVGSHAQLYGGTSDGVAQLPAGTSLTGPTQWNGGLGLFGPDSGDVVVNPADNNLIYGMGTYGQLFFSIDGGTSWSNGGTGGWFSGKGLASYLIPLIGSPNNPNELLAGASTVYRSTNWGSDWTPLSSSTFLDPMGAPLSAVAVAPGNDNVIYVGSNLGNIMVTTNGGTLWVIGPITGSTQGKVTGIAIDPTNSNVAYVTFAAFAPQGDRGEHVFKTTTAGGSWTDISQTLPNIPFESILVSPNNPQLVIAGSDVGVFASMDGGATWGRLGSGLPNVAVDQLFTNRAGTTLFAATHGRGMWTLPLDQALMQVSPAVVSLSMAPGATPGQQTLTLHNPGSGTLQWSASFQPSASWVSASPVSGMLAPGASQQVTLTFSATANTPQTYTTNLVFNDTVGGLPASTIPITVVTANVSKTWYFAEGYTGSGFTEFLTLENPNASPNTAIVEYLLGSGAPITKNYALAPNSRTTLVVNQEVGANQNVSMVVTGSLPLVAERPMYFTYTGLAGFTIPGGTDVLGATQLGQQFDFGYINTLNSTTVGNDPYLTFLNPNSSPMNVTIDYFAAAGGAPIVRTHSFAANSRGTVNIRTQENLPQGSYSALVSLDVPGLVERPYYLKDAVTGYTGAADVVGVSTPQTDWYFAEGYTNTNFSERYYLSNPNPSQSASATVTFFLSNGTTQSTTVSIPAGGQVMVDANALLGNNVNNSAHVSASLPILAERFMSFSFPGATAIPGATDVLGTNTPSNLFYFAEGYTGAGFDEYLTIENPSATQTATVTVTFYPDTGGAPTVQVYTIAPSSRFTLFTANVLPNASFSMQVVSNVAIVAERPMYFNFTNSGQTGGTDVVGYQP
jgi:photosystem II stability/assembly factor-like uncharacterized protein